MSVSAGSKNELARLRRQIAAGEKVISVSGLTSTPAKAFVLANLQKETKKMFVIVAGTNNELENWQCDLEFWLNKLDKRADEQDSGPERPALVSLPSFETDVYSGISPHAETQEKRALALWRLAAQRTDFLIASAKSLITKTPSPDEVKNLGAELSLEEDFPPELLIENLLACGYVREEPIQNIGEFSVRGGILDLWSPSAERPVRIEFFGDTVDSIREFDPETQLSTGNLKQTTIAPMREFAARSEDFTEWSRLARERFADEKFAGDLKDRTDFSDEGESFSGWEFLFPLVRPREFSLFDFVKDAVFVIDEPAVVEQTLSSFYETIARHFEEISEAGEIGLAPEELFLTGESLRRRFAGLQRLELRALGKAAAETGENLEFENEAPATEFPNLESGRKNSAPLFLFPTAEIKTEIEIASRSTRKFHGNLRDFTGTLKPLAEDGQKRVLIAAGSHGIAERLSEILRDYEIESFISEQISAHDPRSTVRITVGDLSAGFEIPPLGLTAFIETDIFGETVQQEYQRPKTRDQRPKSKLGAFISDFRDLKPGDFVVHVDHGIGRFEGLQTIQAQGAEREFMLLTYAEGAKLFVPVERLDLVSRYGSSEGTQPALDRLGGLGWQKTKARAKRAMRDMADELLRLYAERKLVQGFAFSADAPWQKEFEDAFPYQLTADQAAAIEDVKADMEAAVPMDRLIVGDVGYGKTEVAMRAAFKAVMDGRQTAVLTPTTVLAYQHFETFKQRFAAFPVTIELLSRFRTSKEQKQVVERAEKGEIDILIGTHRILSTDVKLPKLGLVIVDEEQRFGVAHKEKLKQLKKKVDVLTLSATPIPRTLNMSLLGMRDMSVIETPPRDRLAINTQVVQFSEGVIKSAIELEMSRSGQVFFIHNRVETIEAIAALVQKIVPQARIAIGHGQMSEKELERVMLDFIDYKYDVLVATTIIENGIDIPRANTIIINRADHYGLSQLYQLRGRVGRSNRRAYAYLLIPSELELTPIARRRLSAIREFSDLGAGFRIAALDLELRGAGNILGGQQSGHLDALGFDLYTKMLERTIAELRGEEIEDEIGVSLNLGVDVSIPQEYISETSQRLRTYKRISSAESESALRQIYAEIQDRYGRIPESVENLFEYARLRKLAEEMRIISIDKTADSLAFKFDEKARVSPERLMQLIETTDGASFSPNGILRVPVENENILENARKVLDAIS